ncbi:TfoX/Sxy family protein [Rickettsiaceae bacterium]|nr:TfoX/Sxy family protein [Rickettsiaceae bacterium]
MSIDLKLKGKGDDFIERIASILEPLSGVSTKSHDGFVGIYKNNFMFCKIKGEEIFLRDVLDHFIRVDIEHLEKLCKHNVEKESALSNL